MGRRSASAAWYARCARPDGLHSASGNGDEVPALRAARTLPLHRPPARGLGADRAHAAPRPRARARRVTSPLAPTGPAERAAPAGAAVRRTMMGENLALRIQARMQRATLDDP